MSKEELASPLTSSITPLILLMESKVKQSVSMVTFGSPCKVDQECQWEEDEGFYQNSLSKKAESPKERTERDKAIERMLGSSQGGGISWTNENTSCLEEQSFGMPINQLENQNRLQFY